MMYSTHTCIFAAVIAAAADSEEPYPSLSDYHDYEPNLEFDDSELHQTPNAIATSGILIFYWDVATSC